MLVCVRAFCSVTSVVARPPASAAAWTRSAIDARQSASVAGASGGSIQAMETIKLLLGVGDSAVVAICVGDLDPLKDPLTLAQAALDLIERLRGDHGDLVFHQSGGCCDNSAPTCLLPHEITPGPGDVRLVEIGGCPFYMAASQYVHWQHAQLVIDAVDGFSGNLSLESGTGRMFLARSRLFADDEEPV